MLKEIERLSRGERKPNLEQAIRESGAVEIVGKVLDKHLTPTELEPLVCKLAHKSGAKVEQPAKNRRNKKGDVDVIARYDFPPYAIGFQVKKHRDGSKTDEYAVRQIIEAMDDGRPGIDIGCVVTTANAFTDDARQLAEQKGIKLIVRDELIQWMLSSGISSFDSFDDR